MAVSELLHFFCIFLFLEQGVGLPPHSPRRNDRDSAQNYVFALFKKLSKDFHLAIVSLASQKAPFLATFRKTVNPFGK